MKNETKKDIDKLCLNFLIDCYFGQSENLLKAAIDRAYVDMASHTLHIDQTETKWSCRFNASCVISNRIKNYPCGKSDKNCFNDWHSETIQNIKKEYQKNGGLSEGQAQKWLNMSIKYIFVFKTLIGSDDERLKDLINFLGNTGENDYFVPVDSYELKQINKSEKNWSTLGSEDYQYIVTSLNTKSIGFRKELESWGEWIQEKSTDKNSYKFHYQEMAKNQEKKY